MKPARVFVISDTHFGHVNILNFERESRPFADIREHNEELVNRWNSVIEPNDNVWHLGDAVFGMQNLWYLDRLNGHKRLVMGNHDRLNASEYLKRFEKIYGCVQLDRGKPRIRIALTHIPIHPYQLEYRFDLNIHGHLHSKVMDDKRYINASCEQINLTPILLDELIERHK